MFPALLFAWRNGIFFPSNAALIGTLWTKAHARRAILRARELDMELPDPAPSGKPSIPDAPLHKGEIQATFGDAPTSGTDVPLDKAMRALLQPERPVESLADLFGSSGFSIEKFGTKRASAARRNEMEAEAFSARREIREDPAKFATACRWYDEYLTDRAGWHRGERELFDVLDRLNEVEDAPKLERARQIVLCWFRSPLSIPEFCRAKGLWPTAFKRMLDAYSESLAQHLTRDRLPLPWVDMVIHSRDVVLGFIPIAEALGRPVGWVEQHAGDLPIGLVQDVPCANEQLLKPYAARKSRRIGKAAPIEVRAAVVYARPLHPTRPPTRPTHGPCNLVYSRARGDALPALAAPVFKLADKDLGQLYCSVNPLRPLAA
jgi:hypothetical protein